MYLVRQPEYRTNCTYYVHFIELCSILNSSTSKKLPLYTQKKAISQSIRFPLEGFKNRHQIPAP